MDKFMVSRQVEEDEECEIFRAFETWYKESPEEYIKEIKKNNSKKLEKRYKIDDYLD